MEKKLYKNKKHFYLAGNKWKIVYADDKTLKKRFDIEAFGYCSHKAREIWINTERLKERKESVEEVFLHEALHAIYGMMGLSWSGEKEEVVVSIQTQLLKQVLGQVMG